MFEYGVLKTFVSGTVSYLVLVATILAPSKMAAEIIAKNEGWEDPFRDINTGEEHLEGFIVTQGHRTDKIPDHREKVFKMDDLWNSTYPQFPR